ncbi:hypothetical protein DPMN_124981 [Dreissena polymorpha]|uniref:Uncharacterized protein n=1 Tax=Dreissena polymorpha TaxID=45954 RepID=A0A9D4GUJ7_DREPO|nr:hypothetical protein DPMN_124981 [Dreissena polymorpha]
MLTESNGTAAWRQLIPRRRRLAIAAADFKQMDGHPASTDTDEKQLGDCRGELKVTG